MITAVDSSVLLDVLLPEPDFGPRSAEVLRRCLREGSVIACEAVWAEVAATFPNAESAASAMNVLQVGFHAPIDPTIGLRAGDTWRRYRKAGGKRTRVMTDFMIGAHAAVVAERLLTRDRGIFRKYFSDVVILDPSRI